jgi:UDP-N-acetylmuramoylalanine--D-glutamate ligase
MIETIKSEFEYKSIALLGFGREGRSTYTFLRKIFPQKLFTIIDEKEEIRNDSILKSDTNLTFITGSGCMQSIDIFDIAIKSPGIGSKSLPAVQKKVRITSQTDIFLQLFGKQVIGITGTKGKSTTSSLVHYILKNAGINSLFVGNIGIPPFDCIDEIRDVSLIVMELSSHQLEYVNHSPHIAILLNLFQEHLDHYHSYLDYQLAKLNIGKYQDKSDYFIFNADNEAIQSHTTHIESFKSKLLSFSQVSDNNAAINLEGEYVILNFNSKKQKIYDINQGQPLRGRHNMYNIMAASVACFLSGVATEEINSGVKTFKGLEHRIEPVGEYEGIVWYNDSIATIPEATIEAVKTLQDVDTLILGGFDRGIEYDILYPFLNSSGVRNIIFVGEAGMRMKNEFSKYGIEQIKINIAINYNEVITIARSVTGRGKVCLLSPAAASYDMFKNFEERGDVFKKNVRELSPSQR